MVSRGKFASFEVRDTRRKPVGLALAGNDLNLARHESVADFISCFSHTLQLAT